uniref:5'-AMP-activated protein kinase subunit beta-1 n=1 Tax=Syphacia muris TaxID=451379 RepID=A0A0N5APD8_9BILA
MLVDDVTEELIKASKKVYEKEELLKEKEAELSESLERCTWLEEDKRKMGEELWLAKERVANQDRELGDLHRQLDDERGESARLRNQIEEEKRKFAETGGVDYTKFQALKREMEEKELRLLDEKSKVEWHLGEVNQWWNDAKWRIGELEADVSHRQWLLDQANQKAYELDAELNGLRHFRDMATQKLDGTFLIRKQPLGERTRWRLAMWTNDSPEDLEQYRRVWFEITAPGAKVVTLSASFVNWECSLTCDCFDKDQGKFGVWVDIPPGRYEFRFVVDGNWTTCENYPVVPNDFGSLNNWRYIN